jgi:hypothetical protein
MIDKIEAMIERGTDFRGELNKLRRASPWDPFSSFIRPSKFYKAVADLRPFGLEAMLHIDQKRYGTHKVELFETGKKGMAEIQSTLEQIVECDPGHCRLGRIDLAADVRDVGLSWFREHAYVQYKQFICAHAKEVVEAELTEMGKKVYQTLYFGKRPSCVRIYDKVAERTAHFELWKKREIRRAKKVWLVACENRPRDSYDVPPLLLPEFPTLQEWLAAELPEMKQDLPIKLQPDLLPGSSPPEQPLLQFPVVTRVENQFGGRVPEDLQTLGAMRKNVLEFNPFARMKLVRGTVVPPGCFDRDAQGEYRFRVKDWMAYMFVHQNWKTLSAAQMWSILNRDRNGKLYLRQMAEFLPVEDDGSPGISEPELYECYRSSISRQLAA